MPRCSVSYWVAEQVNAHHQDRQGGIGACSTAELRALRTGSWPARSRLMAGWTVLRHQTRLSGHRVDGTGGGTRPRRTSGFGAVEPGDQRTSPYINLSCAAYRVRETTATVLMVDYPTIGSGIGWALIAAAAISDRRQLRGRGRAAQ